MQQQALGMAQHLNLLTQFMVQQESERHQARERDRQKKKAPYSRFNVAKLLGYVGVDKYTKLPPIWNEFLESDDHDDHRGMLEARMETWFRRKGKAMPKGIYFTKEQMKQIMSIKFSPGGAIGVLETAAQGVSNAICLPRTIGAIQNIQRFESVYDKARQNLTLKEVQRKDKGLPIEPPSTLDELQKNVEVFKSSAQSTSSRIWDLIIVKNLQMER
jgi:hypothetical protein